jgi:hypothetical protein
MIIYHILAYKYIIINHISAYKCMFINYVHVQVTLQFK